MISQRIRVSGVVQGVGFRAFVWRVAKELNLTGWVRNDTHGVKIEVSGPAGQVQHLVKRLHEEAPEMARVDSVTLHDAPLKCAIDDFYILHSRGAWSSAMIGHDTAICRDCLAEMFDPAQRRWRYAFSHCKHCGPRYTICRSLPYARERTSFKPFTPCTKCQNESRKTADRHYQNEANCCPKCGPQLALLDAQGQPLDGDPVAKALALLKKGKILALKGPGGFHLACDAHNATAVALLRERKNGDEKPFSVMLANAPSASMFVKLGIGEPSLLAIPERPAILLKKRASCDEELPGVATGLGWLGVMMPCTPLQYLLFHEAAGRPQGLGWLDLPQKLALVMTAADPGGRPSVIDNQEALLHLSGIADAFLMHDREILIRCDDSVARSGPGGLQLVRRARGYTPRPMKLPHAGPSILAVGGKFKNTVCVTRGNEAFVSQHIGDLDKADTCDFFDETIKHFLKILEVKPVIVAHDFDRDFLSTRYAIKLAHQRSIPTFAVQHHHAHVASVLAEHRIEAPVTALVLDGVAQGVDGAAWGGELMHVDGVHVKRLGHLASLRMASEHAAREPWQMAASVLHQLGRCQEIMPRFAAQQTAAAVANGLMSNASCHETSSLSCYINAAAGLLGIKHMMAFDGQAAMLLEGIAERYGDILPLNDGWTIENGNLNLLPLFAVLADEKDPERGAAIFHATLVAALADWVNAVAPSGSTVVGSGACFHNMVMARSLRSRLGAHGLHMMEAHHMPPNDGGLSLGQAWVAQQYLLK